MADFLVLSSVSMQLDRPLPIVWTLHSHRVSVTSMAFDIRKMARSWVTASSRKMYVTHSSMIRCQTCVTVCRLTPMVNRCTRTCSSSTTHIFDCLRCPCWLVPSRVTKSLDVRLPHATPLPDRRCVVRLLLQYFVMCTVSMRKNLTRPLHT